MREVLGGLSVAGVTTNLSFLRWLVAHPQFEMGNLSTRFIEKYYRPGAFPVVPIPVLVTGAVVRLLSEEYDPADPLFVWHGRAWRLAGQELRASLIVEGHNYDVELFALPGRRDEWNARVSQGDDLLFEGEITARLRSGYNNYVASEGTSVVQLRLSHDPLLSLHYTWGETDDIYVEWERREYRVKTMLPISTERMDKRTTRSGENTLESPMPGKVLKLLVDDGEDVVSEQPLIIIEAMKMEFTVRAPHDGRVAAVKFRQGEQVAVGDVLIELEIM